jgi:hypothetical protein
LAPGRPARDGANTAVNLDELQQIAARLLRSRRALPARPDAAAFADAEISGNARLSPVEQLEIYREQFWLRHTSALLEDFPGVAGVIGQADWERLCEEYLERTPPASYDLAELGHAFATHVASSDWLEHRLLVADMARLEWAYVVAFGAEDAPRLDPAAIAAVPDEAWESASLVLSPSLTLLRVSYPVVALRRKLVTPEEEAVAIPEPEAACLAVFRRDLSTRVETLSEAAFALLEALRDGKALMPALQTAAERTRVSLDEIGAELGAWFSAWSREGIVVRILTRS